MTSELGSSALFASRFRECASRALLLPRRQPGRRTPLWQQRQRAAGLLEVASGYPTFPILLETTRECLRDVFDLPALREVLTDVRSRRVRVVPVTGASPTQRVILPAATSAYEATNIFARASGYIAERFVDIGSPVKKGDALAVITAPETSSIRVSRHTSPSMSCA